ncbi:MAG: hypothetical protein CL468_00010 [Acidimicrobiaceae bacterium]|nr:hypothetical protein [Acidimicrobiaceae bacterium]
MWAIGKKASDDHIACIHDIHDNHATGRPIGLPDCGSGTPDSERVTRDVIFRPGWAHRSVPAFTPGDRIPVVTRITSGVEQIGFSPTGLAFRTVL